MHISAKDGRGVPELLRAVIDRVPAPAGKMDAPLRALIFDSYYDKYRGSFIGLRANCDPQGKLQVFEELKLH